MVSVDKRGGCRAIQIIGEGHQMEESVMSKLGNEMREGRYWEEEQDRLCRLCGNGLETWEHIC